MQKKINYFARDFRTIKTELVNFTKKHFPDTYTDFNDASIGMMLIELHAALGDMLSFNTDRAVQETILDFAQERRSIMAHARNNNIKIPFKRPAITICDFSVEVPVKGDTFDLSYAPLIIRGVQVQGGGQNFESLNDIDFSSPFNSSGLSNRIIIPQIDGAGKINSYVLTKREIVIAGTTQYFKKVITSSDARPFLQVNLPDRDILSIENIINLDGTDYTNLPTLAQQINPENLWYPVDSLAESQVFVEQPLLPTDRQGILVGQWKSISRKFLAEYTDKGFMTITFGNGYNDISDNDVYTSDSSIFLNQIQNAANLNSLGDIPRANTTMYFKYRVGGGVKSNVGINTLTSIGTVNMFVSGENSSINLQVQNSLKVTNPLPALGGVDEPSIEELRYLVKYNNSAQNRCVALKDYYARVYLMNGKFGVPYKASVAKINNKIDISILGQDANGGLTNQSTSTLKKNIEEYLKNFKSINDYVVVRDGRIINIGFEFDIFADSSFNRNEIASEVINVTYNFIQELNLIMGQDIYLSQLIERVNNVGGVLNIIDFRVYNKVGDNLYSLNQINQPLIDSTTKQIDLIGKNAIFAEFDEIFEIKYINRDIKVRFVNN